MLTIQNWEFKQDNLGMDKICSDALYLFLRVSISSILNCLGPLFPHIQPHWILTLHGQIFRVV